MTAGHNALRESAPGQKLAFDDLVEGTNADSRAAAQGSTTALPQCAMISFGTNHLGARVIGTVGTEPKAKIIARTGVTPRSSIRKRILRKRPWR
jgi:hypothetical protein